MSSTNSAPHQNEAVSYQPSQQGPARRESNLGLRILGSVMGVSLFLSGAYLVMSEDTPQSSQAVWIEDVDGQTNTELVHFDLNGQQGTVQYFCARDGEGHYGASGMVRYSEGLAFHAQRFVNTLGSSACYNGVASADSDEAFLAVHVALMDDALVPDALKAGE